MMERLHLRADIWTLRTRLPHSLSVAMLEGDRLAVRSIAGFGHLLVTLSDGQDRTGVGYCRGGGDPLQAGLVAQQLLAQSKDESDLRDPSSALDSDGLLYLPVRLKHEAAAAVSLAAWDLTGRRLGRSCAELWGRLPGRRRVGCYYSGFWLDQSVESLREEARRRRGEGYRAIKIRAGLSVEQDLERLAVVAETFDAPGVIALEALGAWTPERAADLLAARPVRLMWLEDPFLGDARGVERYRELIERSAGGPPIATGEDCCTMADVLHVVEAGRLSHILLDVAALGGPLPFLAVARELHRRGVRVGAHLYAGYARHLLAALPQSLPVEVADWSDTWFRNSAAPAPDGQLAVRGAGFDVELDTAAVSENGELFASLDLDLTSAAPAAAP